MKNACNNLNITNEFSSMPNLVNVNRGPIFANTEKYSNPMKIVTHQSNEMERSSPLQMQLNTCTNRPVVRPRDQ